MEPRLIIAYSLLALIALTLAAWLAYRTYFAGERSYLRRTRRENALHDSRMRERSADTL